MPALDHFRGFVEEITPTTVWARFVDDGGVEERMEFPKSRIPPSELPYLAEGAPFTMSIFPGRVRIYFLKRKWTQKQLDRARAEGEALWKQLQARIVPLQG